MASSHAINLLKDIVISTATTGLYDANGEPLSSIDITTQSGLYGYSLPFQLSPKSIDHVLTATCDGCTVDILLEMSPDKVNWCTCVLSNGTDCEFTCTATAGDCTIKVIDVPVLQFVRVKIGNAGSTGGTCTAKLNFTLN